MAKTIKHVFGNRIELHIPLSDRAVSVTDGNASESIADLYPTGKMSLRLSKGYGSYNYDVPATVSGNTVVIVDNGTIPVGTWSMELVGTYPDGKPLRWKKNVILEVVDATADGGDYTNDEVDVLAYYPIIEGRWSAIVIDGGKIYLEVGGRLGEDDDPNDGKAMISTGYGEGHVERENGKIILYI